MNKGETNSIIKSQSINKSSHTNPEMNPNTEHIAYFSMEIGFKSEIPTYSGGLGVLAGDTLKAFADLGVHALGITLLSRKGYFYQTFDENNYQEEKDYEWNPSDALEKTDLEIEVSIENKTVYLNVWKYKLEGIKGKTIPIYFLDSNNEKNSSENKILTDHLYGGDLNYRLQQEIILGIGGMKLLKKINANIKIHHLNEGHAALLITELYNQLPKEISEEEKRRIVKEKCSFTTHTPVPAGHDSFDKEKVKYYLDKEHNNTLIEEACEGNQFSMTKLAMNNSNYVNAVSRKHKQVSQELFPNRKIDYITNGIHSRTWIGKHHASLYDKYIIDWRENPLQLRNAIGISNKDILEAHQKEKQELIDFINTTTNAGFNYETFTIGFARRATGYKRAELLFKNINTLEEISKHVGKIQIVFSGKAHPRDTQGKEIIQRIKKLSEKLPPTIKLIFIENYNMYIGHLLTSGVDLWLNTPQRPLEASGTSGMKAAHNGIPSLSILDGWWIEGCIEGITGWSINGENNFGSEEETNEHDANSLYEKLQEKIIPMYYQDKESYAQIMKQTIAINASYFNTHRMAKQYIVRSYHGTE